MRRKAAEAEAAKQAGAAEANSPLLSGEGQGVRAARCSQTWAMLIKRVYEIDPLTCSQCGGQMKVVAFLEPPQGAVIEKILRHCGLWNPSTPRAPPPEDGWGYEPDADWESHPASPDSPGELTFVEIDEFLATF